MRPFPDCATARFVACGSEHDAPVVLSRQQNADLRPERYKPGSSRRQERICWEIWIVSSQAGPVEFRAQPNFARWLVGARPTFHRNSCEQNQNRGSSEAKT